MRGGRREGRKRGGGGKEKGKKSIFSRFKPLTLTLGNLCLDH